LNFSIEVISVEESFPIALNSKYICFRFVRSNQLRVSLRQEVVKNLLKMFKFIFSDNGSLYDWKVLWHWCWPVEIGQGYSAPAGNYTRTCQLSKEKSNNFTLKNWMKQKTK
jgi:hypothetical protein